jgi:uncharacterized protein YbjT (DUF2867 family)
MRVFVAERHQSDRHAARRISVANGHEVVAMNRTEGRRGKFRRDGDQLVVADALDPDAGWRAASEADVMCISQRPYPPRSTGGAPDPHDRPHRSRCPATRAGEEQQHSV